MFVIYQSTDELLITTKQKEQAMRDEWFTLRKRRFRDFERRVSVGNVVEICVNLLAR